ERFLHELFRVFTVSGDEVESLEEALVLLHEERVESGPTLDAVLRETDDLTLCSHGPWTHGGHAPLMRNRTPDAQPRDRPRLGVVWVRSAAPGVDRCAVGAPRGIPARPEDAHLTRGEREHRDVGPPGECDLRPIRRPCRCSVVGPVS